MANSTRRSDHTLQQRRDRQPWPKDKLFRILSIDGGGMKGVFPAAYLAELERRFLSGESIASYFDLVAGTSTGGILALGLASGMRAKEALDFYLERGRTIFPKRRGFNAAWHYGRWAIRPKHDQQILRDQLAEVFGTATLNDAKTRLAIPCFEGSRGEPYIYKTPHHPDYRLDRLQKLSHVALHTAAAPSFFASVENDQYVMVDGGLWANNPVMIAVIEAITAFDVAVEDIRILSLGTGDSLLSTAKKRSAGWVAWILPNNFAPPLVFQAAVKAQSDNALGQAGLLVGRPNLVRVSPFDGAYPIELDDADRAIAELPLMAMEYAERTGNQVAEMFLSDHAVEYIACSKD